MLKGMGYLAVHNQVGTLDVPLDKAGNVIGDYVEHHIFNLWRDADEKYAGFFKRVFGKQFGEFDVNDFTVPVNPANHRKVSNQITAEWRKFIDEWDEVLKKNPGKEKEAAVAAIDKAYELAEKYGYDISKVRRYRTVQKFGSAIDKLWRLENTFRKIDNIAKNARWLKWSKAVGKRLGSKFLKAVPVVGNILMLYYLASAVANPEEAVANELEISEEAAHALLHGEATIVFRFWKPGEEAKRAELKDGGLVVVGDTVWAWEYKDGNDKSKGTVWKKSMPIVGIRTTTTPGVVDLYLDQGEGLKQLPVFGVESLAAPVPEN